MEEQTSKNLSVITGGAGGMGLAAARLMGRDHHILICDVNQARLDAAREELIAAGITCDAERCDITDRKSVEALVQTAASLGRVRSVIHTAGLSPQMADPGTIWKVNAVGTININEAFYRLADEGFAMVNVSSVSGHMLPGFLIPSRGYRLAHSDIGRFLKRMLFVTNFFPKKARTGVAYALSKNFVSWYSKSIAGRFGSKGARVVAVSPGSFDTEMGRLEKETGSGELVNYSALKRFGKPEEVAELLAFCASDKAGYLTGVDIPCDGGVLACITPRDIRNMQSH
ncbi:SDR family oxidoreductase [Pseudomaricurvus sp. HS19]|uniref:SDR family oxidoreductase n=1 Tax=Pseudomaricurvus sp. HS19 TaxID=2692626 RepID=UPI00136DB9D0|nr:SDR family oxidoreductase [Pseudomaricurvus sp. HS19]MYM64835.1 SDR family oxidoreductase [Pseudomaricurvus sp. HS19]